MCVSNWIKTIEKLSCVKRFSQCELSKAENVLEHSGFVSLISYQISKKLCEEGFEIDVGLSVIKSLIHDVEESKIGDISKPSKYNSTESRDIFHKYECDVSREILSQASLSNSYEIWESAKNGPEGAVVSFSDTLSAILKFHNEIFQRRNMTMIDLLLPTAFVALSEKLSALELLFKDSKIIREYSVFCKKIESDIIGVEYEN